MADPDTTPCPPPVEDRGPWLQTYTGRAFYPLAPRVEDVHLEDIAHALAHQCRFAGHVRTFYSVAEHSVRASVIVPREYALAALMHDATEAYVVDVPRPLKQAVPAFGLIEDAVAIIIGAAFGVELSRLPKAVKLADQVMLATEARDLMAPPPRQWMPMPEPLAAVIEPWGPEQAKGAFLQRFEELRHG